MKKIKILLVDDNALIRVYIGDIIWVHGYTDRVELTTSDNIETALKQIRNHESRPDAIFLDLSIPLKPGERPNTRAGFDLLHTIKQDPDLKKIKVIVFSGFSDLAFRREAIEMGAEAYLVKDENLPQDLINALKKYFDV